MNTWDDSNIFFTLGKAMMNGFVPYRDFYEQKGPLLYFLNGLGYLVSDTGYLGIYFIQAVSLSVTLLFSFRIARLFLDDSWAVIAACVVPMFIFYSTSYSDGGNAADEYILPFLAVSLYYFIHYLSESSHRRHRPGIMLLHGIMSGCVFLIKYNSVGFWAGFVLVITIRLVSIREFRNVFVNMLMGAAGVLIALAPYMLYAYRTGSLSDWCGSYLLGNLRYAKAAGFFTGEFALLKMNLFMILALVLQHTFLTTGIVCGILLFVRKRPWNTAWSRAGILCSSFFLYMTVYGGGRNYKYYIIPLTVFTILGVVALLSCVQHARLERKQMAGLILGMLVVTVFSNFSLVKYFDSTRLMRKKMVQQKFADIINKEKNPTLMEVIAPDKTGGDGFYTAANALPVIKYFFYPNVPYELFPYPLDSQYEAISKKKVIFLVTSGKAEREKEDFETELGYSLGNLPIHKKIEQAIAGGYSRLLSLRQNNKDGRQIYTLYKLKEGPENARRQ